MKKVMAMALSVMTAAAMLTGCGDNDSSSAADSAANGGGAAQSQAESTADGNSAADSTEDSSAADTELKAPVNDGPIDPKNGCTENMLIRSVLREGDTSRLAAKLKLAKEDPEQVINVTFLGDSITAGSITNVSSNQYVNQVKDWMEENISYYVNVTNAGIGATDSYLGVHRAQRDVLDINSDIIFIEFINDQDTDFYKTTMDSLVRKCLNAENMPAVILVEMTLENGSCPQNVHSQIAEAYDLPVISYHDAMQPELDAGNLKWSDISPDDTHPNDDGHVMLGQMIINFIENVNNNLDSAGEPKALDVESPTGDKYANAKICDKSTNDVTVTDEGTFTEESSPWNFKDGWATKSGGSITFEMEFKNLGALYYKRVDGTGAQAAIKIDGESAGMLDGDFTGGWGDYAANTEIYTSEETAKHTVTVEVLDGDAKNFEILGWLVS